jgi:hypothetical protein
MALCPARKHHVPNLAEDLDRLAVRKPAIVDEPVWKVGWSRPSTRGSRRTPMGNVHVKLSVALDLEQHDVTVVPHCAIDLELPDARLDGRNIGGP